MYSKSNFDTEDGDRLSAEALLPETEQPIPRKYSSRTGNSVAIHLTIVSLYTFLFLVAWNFHVKSVPNSIVNTNSPGLDGLEIVSVWADIDAPNSFRGNPSMEVDEAWSNLMNGYNTRLSPNELEEMGQSSILLADGSGDYWGIMNSFHNLHCLNKIRQHLAPEYYGVNDTRHREAGHIYAPHIAHCIESIRHYIMCHADVTMLTWYWPDEEPEPPKNHFPQTNYSFEHQCVNWSKLQDWAIVHSFELSPETLLHPKYGYPW